MKWIVVTSPSLTREGEALDTAELSFLHRLFEAGIDALHLRKPSSSPEACRQLLQSLSTEERRKTVLHDHFFLAEEFSLKGLHLNGRNPLPPDTFHGSLSRSCHSLQEIRQYKELQVLNHSFDYLFLSPVFDSISKSNYPSAFTQECLQEASNQGIIDEKVMALGGVESRHLPYLAALGFGGAAMLGAVQSLRNLSDREQIRRLKDIRKAFDTAY